MMEPRAAFDALGSPARWQSVAFLARPSQSARSREDGVCACDLESFRGLSQPTVGHPTKHLMEAGLIHGERRGRWVSYALRAEALRQGFTALDTLARAVEAPAHEVPV